MGNVKVPRAGTKTRAVYDKLLERGEHRWKELFDVYADAGDGPSNPYYVSLTLGWVLKRYAKRVRKGVYVFKFTNDGDRPTLDDICGACGKRYGAHYGYLWPEPLDCPSPAGDRQPEDKRDSYFVRKGPAPVVNDAAPEVPATVPLDEYPFGRKFKPGDRVRYTGRYSHFDYYGVPVGTEFTVDFYGSSRDNPVSDHKGFLWFKEEPPAGKNGRAERGGHSDHNFELVVKLTEATARGVQQLERSLEGYQELCAEQGRMISDLRSEVESRDTVIKNQLAGIGKLEAQVAKLEQTLDQIHNLSLVKEN